MLHHYHDTQTDTRKTLDTDALIADLNGILTALDTTSTVAYPTWLAVGYAIDALLAGEIDKAAGMLSEVGIEITPADCPDEACTDGYTIERDMPEPGHPTRTPVPCCDPVHNAIMRAVA